MEFTTQPMFQYSMSAAIDPNKFLPVFQGDQGDAGPPGMNGQRGNPVRISKTCI